MTLDTSTGIVYYDGSDIATTYSTSETITYGLANTYGINSYSVTVYITIEFEPYFESDLDGVVI